MEKVMCAGLEVYTSGCQSCVPWDSSSVFNLLHRKIIRFQAAEML